MLVEVPARLEAAQTGRQDACPTGPAVGRAANPVLPIWKSAIRQVWKPALQDGGFHGGRLGEASLPEPT